MLASGSAGNAAFLATSKTRILIDAGLSVKELTRRLAEIGESPEDIDAVVITHEHSDHIAGLARFVRFRERKKKPVPVYLTRLTAPAIEWTGPDGKKTEIPSAVEKFQAGSGWMIGNVAVQSFGISHDAIDPVGFTFIAEGVKVGVATDLGYVTESLRIHLRRVQMLLFESNHDEDMLRVGPYPWSVKQRVLGRQGHLSNNSTCEFLEKDLDGGIQTLILGHLSEHNNHPEIVRVCAAQSLERRGIDPTLVVAQQKTQTEVFTY